jgi:hypothetical protein
MSTLPNTCRAAIGLAGFLLAGAAFGDTVVATFDDLPAEPALTSGTALYYANNNSLDYLGITWDANFSVVGDEYKVNTDPSYPTPNFGIPHSGHFFVSNQGGISGLVITTPWVLTGAWFGRNEYYGYGDAGGGAEQITITALAGSTELASVVFELPDTHPGEPEPLSFVDTASFATLAGITGYRIDRREFGTSAGNWVADDFQFAAPIAVVPLPGALPLFGTALAGLLGAGRRRTL